MKDRYINQITKKVNIFYTNKTKTMFNFLIMFQMKLSLIFLLSLAVISSAKEEGKEKELGTVIGIDLGTTYSW